MMRHPLPGQRVLLRYNARLRAEWCNALHLATGTVLIATKGPGPRNALIRLDSGADVVVPFGNMFRVGELQ